MEVIIKPKMADYTTFKVGGIADVMAVPKNQFELLKLIEFLKDENIIYYVVGNGSNLLVSDKGLRGCVVHIGQNMSTIKVVGKKMYIEAGAKMSDIADAALKNNLTGFESLSGIPGTIGGAIMMNAGAYNQEIGNLVVSVDVIDENNNIITLKQDKLDFSYRHSCIEEKGYVVVAVRLSLEEGDKTSIQNKMNQVKVLRESKQPIEPSAGSTFKRPENGFASLLIQESNLQGERIGDAEVSTKHAGFIVNKGQATANDIFKLINKIKESIKTYYNITLEPEIKIWGKF